MIKVTTTIAVNSTMCDKIDDDDGNTLIRLIMMMEILDCSDVGLCREVEGGLKARLRKKQSFYRVILVIPKVFSVCFLKENSFITPSTVLIKAGRGK